MIRFSYILRFIVFLFASSTFFSYYFLVNKHPYYDSNSLLLIELICIFIFYTSGKYSTRFPLIILFNFLIILFVVSRAFVLLLIPKSFVECSNMNSEMMNSTLLFIFLGVIASTFGVKFGCSIQNSFSVDMRNSKFQNIFISTTFIKLLGVAFFLITVFQLLNYYINGYSGSTGSGAGHSFFWRYPARIFHPTIMLMVLLAAYIVYCYKRSHKWAKYMVIFCTVFFISFFLAQGSRSGLFEVAILCLIFNIVRKGNFRIRLSIGKMILVLFSIPLSITTYLYASSLRVFQREYGDISFNSLIENYYVMISTMKELPLSDIVSTISYRINSLEQVFRVMYGKNIGLYDISNMVNLKTTLLSSLDRMVPGKLFEGIVRSEYAFGFMFQPGGVIDTVPGKSTNYVGYEWNAFGISYQLFGYWGAIIFVFVISALFGYLTNYLIKKRNLWGYSYGIFCVYSYHMWIINYGIDNLIDKIWSLLITMTFYLVCIEIFRGLPGFLQGRNAIFPPRPL